MLRRAPSSSGDLSFLASPRLCQELWVWRPGCLCSQCGPEDGQLRLEAWALGRTMPAGPRAFMELPPVPGHNVTSVGNLQYKLQELSQQVAKGVLGWGWHARSPIPAKSP